MFQEFKQILDGKFLKTEDKIKCKCKFVRYVRYVNANMSTL